jgi:hypothetical protein
MTLHWKTFLFGILVGILLLALFIFVMAMGASPS